MWQQQPATKPEPASPHTRPGPTHLPPNHPNYRPPATPYAPGPFVGSTQEAQEQAAGTAAAQGQDTNAGSPFFQAVVEHSAQSAQNAAAQQAAQIAGQGGDTNAGNPFFQAQVQQAAQQAIAPAVAEAGGGDGASAGDNTQHPRPAPEEALPPRPAPEEALEELPSLLSEQEIVLTASTLTTAATQSFINTMSGGGGPGGAGEGGGGAPGADVTASDAYNQLQSYNQFLRRLTTAGINQDYNLLLRERGLRDSYYGRVGQQQVEGIGLDYESRGVSLSSARARAETTALGNIEAQQGYEDFRGVQTFLNTVKSALYNDAQRQLSQAEFGLQETQRLALSNS